MSGWLALAVLGVGAAVALGALGLRGAMLQIAAAALLVGAAGYALQGRPGLPGAGTRSRADVAAVMPLAPIRRAFYGQFTSSERWLIISESYARRGKTADSVNLLRNAVGKDPADPQLWVGLGNALVEHSGMLNAPAEFAYRRAAELSPGHPAPRFFLGLAHARGGDREAALTLWRAALADAPAEASWRPLVEDAVTALEGGRPAGR